MHAELILDIDIEGHNSPELVAQRQRIIKGLVDQVISGKYNFLSIEGVPGIGKTFFTNRILEELSKHGIAVALATMDMDVLPREERGDLEITNYHPGDIAKEAILRHQNGSSSSFGFMEYEGETGQHSKESGLTVPGKNNGLLIVEGFTASAFVEALIDSTVDRLYEVYLTGPMELAEQQRLGRDLGEKGLGLNVVNKRLEMQRSALKSFDRDTQKRFAISTPAVTRYPVRL